MGVGEPQPIRRLRWVARCGLAWAALILARLVHLQIASHEDLRKEAERQQVRTVELPATRGSLLDRTGAVLAMSVPADSVCVNPLRLPDAQVAAELAGGVLQIKPAVLKERIEANQGRGFLWVKRKITPEESARLKSLNLEWIEFRKESRRIYPKGRLTAHVLGSVNHEERGNAGLELELDGELRGKPGAMRLYQDVRERGFDSQVFAEPQPGKNIRLSVDERIQFVAERALREAVEANGCRTGSIVVMIPSTGEILAMTAYPTYDPNEPPKPGEDLSPRLNLAVSAPFEPGSVFKVITVAAALEQTALRPETVIPCGNGIINLFGRIIHDHDPYGALSVADVLAKSSNIGAIQIGLRVGDPRMFEYVKRFGFGAPTGLGLPAEDGGRVRPLKVWSKSSIGSVAMGHELTTTTLQLARACSAIANGGLLVRPRLLLDRRRPGETAVAEPVQPPVRILAPETAITMRQMMEGVVLAGTGKKARLAGWTSGGKTGSAQIYDHETGKYTHRYNASFMGFAPLANPAVVVVVTLNGASKYGGTVAAPVFREVASAALRLLDVPKDVPELIPVVDEKEKVNDLAIAGLDANAIPEPAPLEENATAGDPNEVVGPRVPDFRGKAKRNVVIMSASLGLPVDMIGSGIARSQAPPAGSVLGRGERIRIEFGR